MPKTRNKSFRRYFFLIFGLIVVLGLISVVKNNNVVYAEWYVDGNGNLVYAPAAGEVLGVVYAKEGESEGGGGDHGGGGGGSSSGSGGGSNSGSSSSGGGSGGNSSGGSSGGSTSGGTANTGGSNGIVNTSKFIVKPQSVKPTEIEKKEAENKTENETENETKNEMATENGTVKFEAKNGKSKTEVTSGGVKVKIEQKDGRLILKAEREDGGEVPLGEQDIFKIEERLDKNTVKIATGSGNTFVFAKGTIGAQSQFPLSVDLATNALSVQTPAGMKVVTVLPDAAVQNMLAANVINRLSTETISQATGSAALKGVGDIVKLGIRNNLPVYEISGLSNQKLLGFIPVIIPTKAVVSAETGALVAKETTPLATLLDLVSF